MNRKKPRRSCSVKACKYQVFQRSFRSWVLIQSSSDCKFCLVNIFSVGFVVPLCSGYIFCNGQFPRTLPVGRDAGSVSYLCFIQTTRNGICKRARPAVTLVPDAREPPEASAGSWRGAVRFLIGGISGAASSLNARFPNRQSVRSLVRSAKW